MAEVLEDDSKTVDVDRVLDSNGFLNEKFEIFTHDYREKKEVPQCSTHEGGSGCCGESSLTPDEFKKKDLVNITRKLQRALLTMESMNEPQVSDLRTALKDVNTQLQTAIKQHNSEFSTTTISLPEFDPVDMALLLGEDEVPASTPMLEKVELEQKLNSQNIKRLLGEAEILLNDFDDMKKAIRR